MFSCSNQPRGCRGRCDMAGGRCRECTVRRSYKCMTSRSLLTILVQMYNFKNRSNSSPLNYKSKLSQPVNIKSSNSPSILESMWLSNQDSMIEQMDRWGLHYLTPNSYGVSINCNRTTLITGTSQSVTFFDANVYYLFSILASMTMILWCTILLRYDTLCYEHSAIWKLIRASQDLAFLSIGTIDLLGLIMFLKLKQDLLSPQLHSWVGPGFHVHRRAVAKNRWPGSWEENTSRAFSVLGAEVLLQAFSRPAQPTPILQIVTPRTVTLPQWRISDQVATYCSWRPAPLS